MHNKYNPGKGFTNRKRTIPRTTIPNKQQTAELDALIRASMNPDIPKPTTEKTPNTEITKVHATQVVEEEAPFNVQLHQSILDEMHQLYIRKNHDYGDSFHLLFQEEGMAAVRIRLGDKLNRLKTLTRDGAVQLVDDEGVRDTLMDLANYAIMGIMEIDRLKLELGNSV